MKTTHISIQAMNIAGKAKQSSPFAKHISAQTMANSTEATINSGQSKNFSDPATGILPQAMHIASKAKQSSPFAKHTSPDAMTNSAQANDNNPKTMNRKPLSINNI